MKFSTYTPTVSPNTLHNVGITPTQASRDINAYGGRGGGEQLGALANVAKMGLALQQKVADGKALEANAEYNRLMSDGTSALMQKKEGEALTIAEDYDKLQKNVLAQVNKKYGGYLYGDARESFNAYTMRDDATRRSHMMQYQMAETDKYHETQFNNQLATCQEFVLGGGGTDAAINEAYNRGIGLLHSRYENYGDEKIKEQERIFKGQLVASALSMAVNMEDYKRMGDIAGKYASFLDPKTRVAVLSMLGKRQRAAHDLRQANDMFAQYGRNATLEDMKNAVIEEMRGRKGAGGLLAYAENIVGQTMENGRVGCAEAYMKLTAPYLKFSAENKDMRWCPDIYRAAMNSPDVTVEKYSGQEIPPGSGILYVEEGDDPGDAENLAHITMADGAGGYIGNSSSARDYEDENGETVRGDGCVVHAQSQEIDGLEIAYIIKPNDIAAKELSELEIEEEANRRYALYQKKVSETVAAENRLVKMGSLEMQDLMNQGVTDIEQYQAVVNKYAIQGGVVNDYVRIPLESIISAEERRQGKAAERAAKGKPSEKMDATLEDYLIQRISTGAIKSTDAIIDICNELGITDPKEQAKCTKIFEDYLENKGAFAISRDDYRTIEAYIPELEGVKGPAKVKMAETIHTLARMEAKKYMAEHDGEMPDNIQLAEMVSKAFTEKVDTGGRTMRDSMFGAWFSKPITISKADLAANGYANAKYIGDGEYMLLKLDGYNRDYKDEDEVLKMIGRSGYDEP